MNTALTILRARYRDVFVLTAILLTAAPVAVVAANIAAVVLKGPQP